MNCLARALTFSKQAHRIANESPTESATARPTAVVSSFEVIRTESSESQKDPESIYFSGCALQHWTNVIVCYSFPMFPTLTLRPAAGRLSVEFDAVLPSPPAPTVSKDIPSIAAKVPELSRYMAFKSALSHLAYRTASSLDGFQQFILTALYWCLAGWAVWSDSTAIKFVTFFWCPLSRPRGDAVQRCQSSLHITRIWFLCSSSNSWEYLEGAMYNHTPPSSEIPPVT